MFNDEDQHEKEAEFAKTENSLSLLALTFFILVSYKFVHCPKRSFKQEIKPGKATTVLAND